TSTQSVEFDAFVSKLDTDGTALVYSTFLGGHARDTGSDITIDSAGNAYVTGQTASLDFPTTAGAFQTSPRGGGDAFVTKLNAAGSALQYSSYLGGNDFDAANSVAIDSSGNAYLTGSSMSADFPSAKPLQGFDGGECGGDWGPFPCSDAFVTKI